MGLAKQLYSKSTCVLILFFLGLSSGCAKDPLHTERWEFVYGFTGLIKVVEEPDSEPLRKMDGVYVISVPESGLVKVQSLAPLGRGRGGVIIANPPGLAAQRPEGGFEFLISPSEGIKWAIVGTHEEINFYDENPQLIESDFEAQLAERTSAER